MKLLAIDSSGLVASAAVVSEDKMISEYTVNNGMTHSQTLLPMIQQVVESAGLTVKDIDYIAISRGPGSFTGLRIGSATAKGLGLALDKPLVEVSTLEALAYNVISCGSLIVPIMDARRNEVYTAVYEGVASNEKKGELCLNNVLSEAAEPITELIAYLNSLGKSVIFTGDGIPVYKDTLIRELTCPFVFAPVQSAQQRAGSVAAIALQAIARGKVINADDHVPTYLRLSQAEREMAESKKGGDQK